MNPWFLFKLRKYLASCETISLRKRSDSLIVFFLTSIFDDIIPVPTPKSTFYVPVFFLFFHGLYSYNSMPTSPWGRNVDRKMNTCHSYLSVSWFSFCDNAIQTTIMKVKYSFSKLYRGIFYILHVFIVYVLFNQYNFIELSSIDNKLSSRLVKLCNSFGRNRLWKWCQEEENQSRCLLPATVRIEWNLRTLRL